MVAGGRRIPVVRAGRSPRFPFGSPGLTRNESRGFSSPLPKLPGLGAALSRDAARSFLPPGWQSLGTVAELIPAGSLVCFPPHSVALTFTNLRLHLYFSLSP